jgi:hypothetical protein
MLCYLDWLRAQLPNGPICLLLDQYRTHETDRFQIKAHRVGISLLWIPKGATGIYQPLERRVFAAVKAKVRAKWRRFYFEHGRACDRTIAAGLLIASWEELSNAAISARWHFDETPNCSAFPELESTPLDSESDEWDEACLDLAPEEDL